MSVVAVPGIVWVVPSPQSTARLVTVPSMSLEVIVRVIVSLVTGLTLSLVKPTVGAWSNARTGTPRSFVDVAPTLSWTVNVTLNRPAAENVCVILTPVPVWVSLKFHL